MTDQDGSVKPDVVEDNEFPVVPAPGETVCLVYTDAVTDVTTRESGESARASCTESKTVGTPYKASNGIGTFSGSGATQGPTATLPCNY